MVTAPDSGSSGLGSISVGGRGQGVAHPSQGVVLRWTRIPSRVVCVTDGNLPAVRLRIGQGEVEIDLVVSG